MGFWKNIKCAFGFHSWDEKTEILECGPISVDKDGVGRGARIKYGDTRRACRNCGRREIMTSCHSDTGRLGDRRTWRVETL